jgi:hypothetical protein
VRIHEQLQLFILESGQKQSASLAVATELIHEVCTVTSKAKRAKNVGNYSSCTFNSMYALTEEIESKRNTSMDNTKVQKQEQIQ